MACSACALGDSGMAFYMSQAQEERALNRKPEKHNGMKAFHTMTAEDVRAQCQPKPKKEKVTKETTPADSDNASLASTSTIGSKLKRIFSKDSS